MNPLSLKSSERRADGTMTAVGTSRYPLKRWAAGLATAAVACALLAALVSGHSDSGAGIFKRADEFLRGGDYEMALKHYRLLVESHPRSEFAARALFQQGLILNTHMKKPNQARATYETLLKNYPESDLGDDALMAIAAIHSEAHQDAEALKAYRKATQLFASNRDVCAEAQVAIGRILFRQGDAKAIDALSTVLREYPDKTSRCAEAQYRLGQCYQEIQRDNDRAVKAYRAVLEGYTDSQFAEPARQAIGLLYYQRLKQDELRVDLESRMKPLVNEDGNEPFIEALRVCLAVRGVRASGTQLAGLTGQAFENQYARDVAAADTPGPLGNPFESVCAAYGLRYEQVEARDAMEAWARLRQTLDDGQPVVALVHASPPRWSAIVGYENKTQQILVKGGGAAVRRVRVSEFDQTLKRPPANLGDAPPPTWAKFVFYSLGGTPRGAQRKRAELRSLKAAAEALRGTGSAKTARGLKAFQELRADLEEILHDSSSEKKAAVIAWGQSYPANLRARRKAGVAYLRSLLRDFNASDQGRIKEAGEALTHSENLLGRFQTQLATLDGPNEGAETLAERVQQALDTLTEIMDHERQASEALTGVVGA